MALPRLKELRKLHKITQVELAKELNLDKSSIAKYETTDVMPSIDVLMKISTFFGVTDGYLLGREDTPQHVNDDEALEYLDELHKRPEMKILFDVSRKATKKDIEAAVAVIETLKKQSENSD